MSRILQKRTKSELRVYGRPSQAVTITTTNKATIHNQLSMSLTVPLINIFRFLPLLKRGLAGLPRSYRSTSGHYRPTFVRDGFQPSSNGLSH